MKEILFNAIHFVSPETPTTLGVMIRTTVILAKEFPVISIFFGIFFILLVAQLIRFKIRKNGLIIERYCSLRRIEKNGEQKDESS